MFDTILFDLDGTLTNPAEGITNSVVFSLKKRNIEVENKTSLYRFIGPPLKESFMRFYGFSEEESERAVEDYREYFRDIGIFENEIYEGAENLLKVLKESGKKIILATSKPEVFAKRILEHFGIDRYFDFIAGASMDDTLCEKADVIAYALKNAGIKDISGTVMIGDRKHDILGARANGIASIGVLFGFGSLDELKVAGADYIAETMEDILTIIQSNTKEVV